MWPFCMFMPGVWILWSKKKIVIIFQKENGNTFTLLIIFIVKSLQNEQNSTNLLMWPPICWNKSAITPKRFNSLDTNSSLLSYIVLPVFIFCTEFQEFCWYRDWLFFYFYIFSPTEQIISIAHATLQDGFKKPFEALWRFISFLLKNWISEHIFNMTHWMHTAKTFRILKTDRSMRGKNWFYHSLVTF